MLNVSAGHALREGSGYAFVDWFAEVVPILAPGVVAPFGKDEVARRQLLHSLGRLLWSRMPLPDNHFRPRPLPKPERNAPCPCGSQRRYKHCCAHAESMPNPFEDVSLLKYVLAQYPRKQLRTLPLAGLDLDELAYIGHEWCGEGRAADAEALLEPIFESIDRLDARAEPAFDALADCYDALGRTGKKSRLIERVGAARDPTLRSAALHRRIAILADQGKRSEAWQRFAEAQRHEPDNPSLAALEITMLLGEGNFERLRERARFWIARLARDRQYDHDDLIAWLRKLADDPVESVLEMESARRPGLAALRRMIDAWPNIECHYAVEQTSAGLRLEPSTALQALEAQWYERADADEPELVELSSGDAESLERAAPGIAWLRDHPLAFQSFVVLDTLARVLRDANLMAGEHAQLEPILERGCALVRLALERGEPAGLPLPWVILDNRPALRLIAALFYLRQDQQRFDEARDIARWMVFALNPNDNHGLREDLSRLCLAAGDAAAALEVCDRYPDDMLLGTRLDRVLALFILQRRDEAETALREVTARFVHALPILLAAAPREPRHERSYVAIGSKDQAREYRASHRDLWEAAGALEWARSAAKRKHRSP